VLSFFLSPSSPLSAFSFSPFSLFSVASFAPAHVALRAACGRRPGQHLFWFVKRLICLVLFLTEEISPEIFRVWIGGEEASSEGKATISSEQKGFITPMVMLNRLLTRLKRQAQAWESLAASDEFAGLTLAGFQGELAKLQDARQRLLAAKTALSGAVKATRMSEKQAMQTSKRVALGMKSHPNHGEDSELVRASGFVTESERRSGLTRKRKDAVESGTNQTQE
jgi:hypothetical protein